MGRKEHVRTISNLSDTVIELSKVTQNFLKKNANKSEQDEELKMAQTIYRSTSRV